MGLKRLLRASRAVLMLALLVPAALALAQDETEQTTFVSPILNIAFDYPADWQVQDGSTIYLSSTEEIGVWAFGAPVPAGEAVVSLQVVNPNDPSATVESFLNQVLTTLPANMTAEPVEPATFDGRPAAHSRVESENAQMLVAVIESGAGTYYLLQGGTAPGALADYEPTMLAILESMEPVEAATPTPEATEAATPQPDAADVDEAATVTFPFRFEYPADWTLSEPDAETLRLDLNAPDWQFGDALESGQAAALFQLFSLSRVAEVTGEAANARALLEQAVTNADGEAGPVEPFTVGGRVGVRATIEADGYSMLTLALDVEGARILAVQLVTAPGELSEYEPVLLDTLGTMTLAEAELVLDEPDIETVTFSDGVPFTFDHPAGWVAQVDGAVVRAASSDALLGWSFGEAVPAGETAATVQLIAAGRVADVIETDADASTAGAFLAFALEAVPEEVSVSPIEAVTVGERPAALARVAGADFEALVLVLEDTTGDLFAIQFAAAPGELPQQEAIALLIARTAAPTAEVAAAPEATEEAPAATAVEVGEPTTFVSVGNLFSFEYPDNFIVNDLGRTVRLGTNEAMSERQGGQPVPEGEASVLVQFTSTVQAQAIIGTTDDPTVESLLEAILQNQLDTVTFTPVESTTIADRPVALSEGSAPTYDALLLTVAEGEDQFFFMFIVTAPGELPAYRPVLERIAETIGFVGEAVTMPEVDATAEVETITEPTLGLTLDYPADWVGDAGDGRIDLATSAALLRYDFSAPIPADGASLTAQLLPLSDAVAALGLAEDAVAAGLLEVIVAQAGDLVVSPVEEITLGERQAAVTRVATVDFEGLLLVVAAPEQDALITIQVIAGEIAAIEDDVLTLAASISFTDQPAEPTIQADRFTLGPFNFEYPTGWATESEGDRAILASSTEILDRRYGDSIPAGEVVVIVEPFTLTELGPAAGVDARGFAEYSADIFAADNVDVSIQPIVAAGRSGALVRAQGPEFSAVGAAVDVEPGRVFTILALAGPGEVARAEQTAALIAESLVRTDEEGGATPIEPDTSSAGTDMAFTQFRDSAAPYTFEYPADWFVRAGNVTYIGTTRAALNARFGDLLAPGQVTINVRLVTLGDDIANATGFVEATLRQLSPEYETTAIESVLIDSRTGALVEVRSNNSSSLLVVLNADSGEVFAVQSVVPPGELPAIRDLTLRIAESVEYAP